MLDLNHMNLSDDKCMIFVPSLLKHSRIIFVPSLLKHSRIIFVPSLPKHSRIIFVPSLLKHSRIIFVPSLLKHSRKGVIQASIELIAFPVNRSFCLAYPFQMYIKRKSELRKEETKLLINYHYQSSWLGR